MKRVQNRHLPTHFPELPSLSAGPGDQLSVYPNPAGETLKVELPGRLAGVVHLTVFDVTGRIRQARTTEAPRATLDVYTLPVGLYLLRALLPDGRLLTQPVYVLR